MIKSHERLRLHLDLLAAGCEKVTQANSSGKYRKLVSSQMTTGIEMGDECVLKGLEGDPWKYLQISK